MLNPKRRNDLLRELGASIRQARKARGWSQAQLAETADLSSHFISVVECGDVSPSLPTLARIAAALNTPLHDLFKFDSLRHPTPRELATHHLLKATRSLTAENILLLTRFLKKLPRSNR